MELDNIIWIIIIIFNTLVYGICCLLIIKRKNFTAISIRSPTLLLCTILSNFIMTVTLILHKIVDNNFISIFYYIFRIMMSISIFLRNERILSCFKYNSDKFNTGEIMEKFTLKRYLLLEKLYVKIFIGLFLLFFIGIIITESIGISCFELFFTSDIKENVESYKSQMYVWISLNFLENIVIMTYIFRFWNKTIKFILKKELYIILFVLFVYSNYISFCNLYQKYDDSKFILISLVFLYIFLLLNGYLPIFSSFFYKNILSYRFTPKLMNNFYLFLTNKECYKAFYVYLFKRADNSASSLKLYTHIMKFKLDIILKISNDQCFREARDIYNKYFEHDGNIIYLPQETLIKIRNKCEVLKNGLYKDDLFDDGLKYIYDQLNTKFNTFTKTEEYKKLCDDIEISSLVHCKMCNTGLINKF